MELLIVYNRACTTLWQTLCKTIRYFEMNVLKEQILINVAQMAEGRAILEWNELLPFITEEAASGDRCPILTF